MKNKIQIFCLNINKYLEIPGGTTLLEIADSLSDRLDFKPVCARVNNKAEDLMYPVFAPKQIEFLKLDSPLGRRAYIRSLCMMLYKAVTIEEPGNNLRIEHSISKGYFCRLSTFDGERTTITEELCNRLKHRMKLLVQENLKFERKDKLSSDVKKIFRKENLKDKILLLETSPSLYTTYYDLEGTADSYYGPLVPSTDYLDVFNILPYKDGFLLMGPDSHDVKVAQTPVPQEKLYKAFTDYLKFNNIIRVSNVGELNRVVKMKRTSQLINVAEAMHDKLIGRISDEITSRNRDGGARIVLLAGPSSSGKTTSTKRLAIQLMTNLKVPKMISLDDYFLDREKTPHDEYGDYDFESLYALDLERLNSDLCRLLKGETINLPSYSFELGKRVEKDRPLRLDKDDVLLIEGIHGLNPDLIPSLPKDDVFKIYVSALTTLCIDDHNWISTTDNRLLRRIVRDNKYRHTSAYETIRRWPSVRRGEEKWIFPFQENADALFNSSLIFEIGVMKDYAIPLLKEVPHNTVEYAEAYRLTTLLNYFTSIRSDQIPTTSLLREFLGGSSFRY